MLKSHRGELNRQNKGEHIGLDMLASAVNHESQFERRGWIHCLLSSCWLNGNG